MTKPSSQSDSYFYPDFLYFFVSQRLAFGADLDFVFLAAALHDRFGGPSFPLLGEGLDFTTTDRCRV